MRNQIFSQTFLNPIEKPIHALMELNLRTIKNFSYFTPVELFSSKKPEEVLEKSINVLIKNSQTSLDLFQNMFSVMESHFFHITDRMENRTQVINRPKVASRTKTKVAAKRASGTKVAAKRTSSTKVTAKRVAGTKVAAKRVVGTKVAAKRVAGTKVTSKKAVIAKQATPALRSKIKPTGKSKSVTAKNKKAGITMKQGSRTNSTRPSTTMNNDALKSKSFGYNPMSKGIDERKTPSHYDQGFNANKKPLINQEINKMNPISTKPIIK